MSSKVGKTLDSALHRKCMLLQLEGQDDSTHFSLFPRVCLLPFHFQLLLAPFISYVPAVCYPHNT